MPNPLPHFIERSLSVVLMPVRRAWKSVYSSAAGLAQDYWKDGNWGKPGDDLSDEEVAKAEAKRTAARVEPAELSAQNMKAGDLWHALPGEISERMWGKNCVTPGDDFLTERLISPLGLTKDMNVLDLSAGLGGRLRKTTEQFGIYVSGLEPDPEIAARGKELSVALGLGKRADIVAYNPMELASEKKYDCVVARETIYRVPDKQKFVTSIVACCKPKAQVSFTDYIVNPEDRDHPAIAAWHAFEQGTNPAGLVEMAEIWAKEGVNIRVHDDMTDFYKTEVKAGLVRFAKFMTSGIKPDAETTRAINKRITTWGHRMAAIEQGMKFYRFYGLK